MSARVATTPRSGEVRRHYRAWMDLRRRVGYLPAGILAAAHGKGAHGQVLVTVYNRDLAGLEDDPTVGRYAVTCEDHGFLVFVDTLAEARSLMADPGDLVCQVCQGTVDPETHEET